jgi:hypothetical protein
MKNIFSRVIISAKLITKDYKNQNRTARRGLPVRATRT